MNRYNNRKTNNDFYYAVDDVEIYNQVVEDFKAINGEDGIEEYFPLLKKKAYYLQKLQSFENMLKYETGNPLRMSDTQEHVEIGEDKKKEFIEDLIKITKKRIDMINKTIKGGSV